MADFANIKIDNTNYTCKDASVRTPSFSEAYSRANINSGESIFAILGKIKKWYSDLKTVAFSGNYNDLSNKPSIPSINWTYHGQTTGTTQINMPSSFTDVLVRTKLTLPTYSVYVQQIFNRIELPDSGGDFYDLGNQWAGARIYISKTNLTLNSAVYIQDVYTSTAVTTIYYR